MTELVPDLLAADRDWLAQQLGPDPAALVTRQLGLWAQSVPREHGLTPPADPAAAARSAARLWGCWRFHWEQAARKNGGRADGAAVAASIRAGRGYAGGGGLGGDVIADVVLASAAVAHDPEALVRFDALYRRDTHARLGPLADRADPHWWENLTALLVGWAERKDGTGMRAAKLATYTGDSGLRGWLALVARRYLMDAENARRDEGKGGLDDIPPPPAPDPLERVLGAECRERLRNELRAALASAGPDARALLLLMAREGLSRAEATAALNLKAWQVTRLFERIQGAILRDLAWDDPTAECLRLLAHDRGTAQLKADLIQIIIRLSEGDPS